MKKKFRRFAKRAFNKRHSVTSDAGGDDYTTNGHSYSEEVLSDAPEAYWRLAETSGELENTIFPQFNLTAINSPTYNEAGPEAVGKAMKFVAASEQRLEMDPPQSTVQPGSQFTLEAWIKPETITGLANRGIIGSYNGSVGQRAFALGVGTTGKLVLNFSSNGGGGFQYDSLTTLTEDTWTHVAATYDDGDWELYINGTSDNSGTSGGSSIYVYTEPFIVGGASWSYDDPRYHFDGWMAEPAVYHHALSAARILKHYEARFTLDP